MDMDMVLNNAYILFGISVALLGVVTGSVFNFEQSNQGTSKDDVRYLISITTRVALTRAALILMTSITLITMWLCYEHALPHIIAVIDDAANLITSLVNVLSTSKFWQDLISMFGIFAVYYSCIRTAAVIFDLSRTKNYPS